MEANQNFNLDNYVRQIARDEFEKQFNEKQKATTQEVVEEKAERLLTTNEAVEFLRCSKPTLHRWKKEGLIPFVRIGVNIRYKESDLIKLIDRKGA